MEIFNELTDMEISKRILNGEKSLYEIIMRRFNSYLYNIGRSYNYSHEDIQDLMQDTFIDAYKNLSQFEGRSSFKNWLSCIMHNKCFRKKKKFSFKNEIIQEINDDSKAMFHQADNNTYKVVQSSELRAIVEDALVKIPENYRMVFSLREINGFNVAETAELLNISKANVKVRLNRSKVMLRNEIKKSYSAIELFEFNAIYCNAMVEKVMGIINNV